MIASRRSIVLVLAGISLATRSAAQSGLSDIAQAAGTSVTSGPVALGDEWRSRRLVNEGLRLGIDPAHGQIVEFVEPVGGHNFTTSHPAALWDAVLLGENGDTLNLCATQAMRFEATQSAANALKLRWSEFEAPRLQVEALVELDASGAVSRWTIAVTNLGRFRLRQVRFPIVPNIPEQPGEHLAVPLWLGEIAAAPRQTVFANKERRREWSYPGATSMQCLALYGERAGLYLSCDDTNAYRKHFAVWMDAGHRLHAGLVHFPERPADPGYTLPYRVVLGTFRGDWFTAAERYREWATNQWWAAQNRLRTGAVPRWVRQTALWMWNRGRSEDVLEPAGVLKKKLGLPVSVFWHWWHGCAYDVGFPEYLPPREGERSFTNAVRRARAQGIPAIVYMNQRLWGMSTESWKTRGAEAFAVKGADGKVHPEVYNTFTKAPCASMCLATRFWRDTYAATAGEAITRLGVDGIYMDQACSSLACYDSQHGHPIGGGNYWMEGFELLSADIRRRCAAPLMTPPRNPIALAGEGVGESWLPYLDLMLTLQVSRERYAEPDGWEPIPFFQAVYHPHAIQYGNYASLTMPPYDELWPPESAPAEPLQVLHRKFSQQFYLEQGRAFVWGQQPTLANFRPSLLRERPDEMAFVFQLARLRARNLRFLADGVLVGFPSLEGGEQIIDMSRLSIYAGQQGGLSTFEKRVPKALGAAWRAPEGSVGLVVVNVTDQSCDVKVPASTAFGFVPKEVRVVTDHSTRRLKRGMQSTRLLLKPREAVVVEFVAR